jgi:hypothetical protein
MATTAFSVANGAGESTERPSTTAASAMAAWAVAGAVSARRLAPRQGQRRAATSATVAWASAGAIGERDGGMVQRPGAQHSSRACAVSCCGPLRRWGRARGPSESATTACSSGRQAGARRPAVARYGGGGEHGGRGRVRQRPAPVSVRGSPLHRTQRRHGRGAAARRVCGGSSASRGNHRFLHNAFFIVSSCLGAREEVVSQPRNDFFTFGSLSSFIDLSCHLFCLGGTLFNADRNYY